MTAAQMATKANGNGKAAPPPPLEASAPTKADQSPADVRVEPGA